MATEKGKLVYKVYRAMTYGLSPFLYLHLQWRRLRGLEHPVRWPERLGRPSLPRPPGPLLWFHAVSLGEGMAAIPVIKHCIQQQPHFTILMTTTTTSAFNVIKSRLPADVIYQFAPLDTPFAMESFLGHWSPNAVVLMESELWPNLILGASRKGIMLALLNARVSSRSFRLWSGSLALPLVSLMLSKFSLIAPLSLQEGIRFQLLQAPPFIINFPGDLKYVMVGVHKELLQIFPNSVMIMVPRHPQQGQRIVQALQKDGVDCVFRSRNEKISPSSNIYVVDTLGELRILYTLTPIAVVGGSFFPGLLGHNISEAAAAGCAVLTGYHVGHFFHMVLAMQRSKPLSVLQVSGKGELVEVLSELFRDCGALEARRVAAKQAFLALSGGIIANVWNLMHLHIIPKASSVG